MWISASYEQASVNLKDAAATKDVSKKIDEYVGKLVEGNAGFHKVGKSCAYVTLASPAYDFGLRVLLASIRKSSSIPIIVLVRRPWDFKTDLEGVYFLPVPSLLNDRYSSHRSELKYTPTKLWIFGLLSIDRIVFLDADCLVLKSIEDLFGLEGFCCASDCVEDAEPGRFNTGVMAFDPSAELRDLIYDRGYLAESYDHSEQGLLNTVLQSQVKLIPVEYNLTRHYSFFHGTDVTPASARVIHYIVKKPWELQYREPADAAFTELDDLWTKYLSHDELLMLVSYWRRRQFLAERSRFGHHLPVTWASIFKGSRRWRAFSAAVILAFFFMLLALVIGVIFFMFIKFH
jgi:hypothetical protein